MLPCLGSALRLPSCPATVDSLVAGELGSAGRVHGGTAAFRTPAVAFGHLEKEEPRAGGGSRLLSLDLFEPRGGVSGDGGCRSARAEAPKGERQLQLHLSVVRPECLYRCRAGRKEKKRKEKKRKEKKRKEKKRKERKKRKRKEKKRKEKKRKEKKRKRKEKSRLLAAAQVPYSLMARLRRHPPCART